MGSKLLANSIIQSIREEDEYNRSFDQFSATGGKSRGSSVNDDHSPMVMQKTSQTVSPMATQKTSQTALTPKLYTATRADSLTKMKESSFIKETPPAYPRVQYTEIPVYRNSKHTDNALGIIIIESNNTLRDVREMILKELEVEDGFTIMKGDFPIPKGQYDKKAFPFFANSGYITIRYQKGDKAN